MSIIHNNEEKSAEKVKCCVWDLDGTLWDGVYAEGNSPTPCMRPGVVETIKALDERGILNSIASRNEMEVVSDALKKVGLWEYFLIPQINWGAKSISMETIAEGLGIGIDTLALIDDDLREREEVASKHPSVRTYDPAQLRELLTLPEFMAVTSSTSRFRRQMYMEEFKRRDFRCSKCGANDEFLQELHLEMTVREELDDSTAERATELLSRANNYHLTGHRDWSPQGLLDKVRQSHVYCLSCDLRDRFGSYGCVGVALLEHNSDSNEVSVLELAMSCRAASKTVDAALIRVIVNFAQGEGATKVRFRLVDTLRNAPLKRFLCAIVGGEVQTLNDGLIVDVDVATFARAKISSFVRVITRSQDIRKGALTVKAKSGFSVKMLGDRCYLMADLNAHGPGLMVLNGSGRFIWQLLQDVRTVDSIAQSVAEKFHMHVEDVYVDVCEFLDSAIDVGIVEEMSV